MTTTFKTTTTRLALVLGLALTAVAGPAMARGDGGAGAGEPGNVMQPMNIQNIQQPPKPKPPFKKLARLQQRCGGLTTGATTACQYGGPQS